MKAREYISLHSVRETVRKEPLVQEHSAHEEHIWWVDMFFFLGFLLSFLMDKLLDTD